MPNLLQRAINKATEAVPYFHSEYRRLLADNRVKTLTAARSLELLHLQGDEADVVPILMPFTFRQIRDIITLSSILRRCHINIREEIFRRGIEIKERFAYKCDTCDIEYDEHIIKQQIKKEKDKKKPVEQPAEQSIEQEPEPEEEPKPTCSECGGLLREPDKNQQKILKKWQKEANENHKTLQDVLKSFEDELEGFDNGWLIYRKEYKLSSSGEIISWELKEITRAQSEFMRWVADKQGNLGGKYRICLQHRNTPVTSRSQTTCQECGHPLYEVIAIGTDIGGFKPISFYIEGEVSHRMKYTCGLLYGVSPVVTLWRKAMTLVKMEGWIHSAYDKRRMPGGVLAVVTKNWESFKAFWKEQMNLVKGDPHYTPIIPVEPDGGQGKAEFIKFLGNMEEMQYTEVRDEFRREIAALYGVTPIFYADTSTSGGLNNEGMQITVQNRTTEQGHAIYNMNLFEDIVKAIGVTDYIYEMPPSEEEDEMAELQREAQRIVNAKAMNELGVEVEYTEDGEFQYKAGIIEKPEVKIPFKPQDAENLGATPAHQTSGMPNTGAVRNAQKSMDDAEGQLLEKEFWERAASVANFMLWDQTFKDMTKMQSNMTVSILKMFFSRPRDKFSFDEIEDELVRKTGIPVEQAETIVRTEYTAVSNAARKMAYRDRMATEGKKFMFKWVGPQDHRTSKICAEVKKRVGDGVELERLESIINDVVIENTGATPDRVDVPHVNCRHKLVRTL